MFNFYIDKLTFLRKLRKDSYICELVVMLKDDIVTLKIYRQIKLLFILTVKQKK